MAYEIKYDEVRNLAMVNHFGTVDRNDLWNGREEAMKLVRDKATPRVMVDMRKIELMTSIMEEFNFARAQSNYSPGSVKVAVLIRKDDPKKKEHHLVETVGQNRGSMLMVFDDQAEAEKWLMG